MLSSNSFAKAGDPPCADLFCRENVSPKQPLARRCSARYGGPDARVRSGGSYIHVSAKCF